MALFASLLTILCFWPPFSFIFGPLWPFFSLCEALLWLLWGPSTYKWLINCNIFTLLVINHPGHQLAQSASGHINICENHTIVFWCILVRKVAKSAISVIRPLLLFATLSRFAPKRFQCSNDPLTQITSQKICGRTCIRDPMPGPGLIVHNFIFFWHTAS